MRQLHKVRSKQCRPPEDNIVVFTASISGVLFVTFRMFERGPETRRGGGGPGRRRKQALDSAGGVFPRSEVSLSFHSLCQGPSSSWGVGWVEGVTPGTAGTSVRAAHVAGRTLAM